MLITMCQLHFHLRPSTHLAFLSLEDIVSVLSLEDTEMPSEVLCLDCERKRFLT